MLYALCLDWDPPPHDRNDVGCAQCHRFASARSEEPRPLTPGRMVKSPLNAADAPPRRPPAVAIQSVTDVKNP